MVKSADQNTYAVVGIGSIGLRHANNLRALKPQARIVAVSQSMIGRGGIDTYRVFDTCYNTLDAALLKETLSAAIICNAAPLHIKHLHICCQAKLPALIEKPLAHSISAVDSFVHQNYQHLPPIYVGYNLRYTQGLERIKSLLQQGVLGRITWARAEVGQYLPDWRPQADYRKTVSARRDQGGGVLLELSHELNYLQYLFGNPTTVQAQLLESGLLDIDVEDQADLLLTYTEELSGLQPFTVQVHLDCLQREAHRSLRIVGSLGTLEWNLITATLSVTSVNNDGGEIDKAQWQFADDQGNATYLAELKNFLAAVESPEQINTKNDNPVTTLPVTTLEEGLQTLRLIESARLASVSGQRQRVNYTCAEHKKRME